MRITFIFTASPHKGVRAQEGLDALLMGSAFAECSAVFKGDAVWQLVPDQAPEAIGHRNFTLGFAALKEYGVKTILCPEDDLARTGLGTGGLAAEVTPASHDEIRALLEQADRVLTF